MKKIFLVVTLVVFLNAQTATKNPFKNEMAIKSKVTTKSSDIVNTDEYIKVSLIDVVLETVSQSNNAKAAREKVRQAKIDIDDAKADYLPSINGTYKYAKTDTRPGTDTDKYKYYDDESYKLTLSQNLYKGGETSANIKNLEKKYEVAKNNYRLVIAKEIQNAVKAYFDVLFNFQSFNVNIENMERLNEILEIVNIKYESGATSIGNLSNIKANVSNAESKLIRVQSKFNESLEFYEYIVGDKFIKTFPYEENFDTTVDDFEKIVQKAILNNITIKNFDLNIAAEKLNLIKATSSFKPKVDLELSAEDIVNQEDYTGDEENYKAQVLFSYNFYNKGKDKNKILTINSKIRELIFRQKEEIRKLKWSLSKLHRSIVSITNSTKSKKEEVSASKDMVNAYWDGFKLGEQDLQELLQGQRQLNTAQIELIDNKKTTVTDYFKLLDSTGELLSFFRLDIDSDNYIDFTRSNYKNLLKSELQKHAKEKSLKQNVIKDQITDVNTTIANNDTNTTNIVDINQTLVDLNTTLPTDTNTTKSIDTNTSVENVATIKKDSLDDLLNFKNQFLEASNDKWTVLISYFDKVYQALDFAKQNQISKNTFVFDTLVNNKVKSNIAYNIFDTQDLATQAMLDLNVTNVNSKVVNVSNIKEQYNNFKNKKLQTKVKKKKEFHTNKEFQKIFLNAPKEYYTLNITSLSSMKKAEELITRENIEKESFVFAYGEEKEWIKVVYGVFATYDEANIALNKLDNLKAKYEPVIELIQIKQDLYHKYNLANENKVEDENTIEVETKALDTKVDDQNVSFQNSFLNAPKEYYTINLATLFNSKDATKFENRYGEKIELFVFKFGADKTYYKAMSGVFESEQQALEAISKLPSRLKRNKPRVERISIKQNLYYKYNKAKKIIQLEEK
ncbi:MAG: TolC family protein [Arcobacteraceae bacterium]